MLVYEADIAPLLFKDETVAADTPTVAVGVGASAPFMASATFDNSANPTAGGVPRKTLYTFF